MNLFPKTKPQSSPFIVTHGTAEHWGAAAKMCLDGLGPDRGNGANMGVLYATEPFADDLGSILTFLRGTTRIENWVGGIVPGLCAQSTEYRHCGALGIMIGTVPDGAFKPFTAFDLDKVVGSSSNAAILHGDPRHPLARSVALDMVKTIPHVVGGLVSAHGPVYQLAGTLTAGGASGALLGPGLDLVVGVTQGCTPIGPPHIVTKSNQNILIELDGLPALDIMKAEAGDLIARDLRRAAGYIHMAVMESDQDYVVQSLLGIDSDRGMLAAAGPAVEGDRVVFVRRDANSAQANLTHMLEGMRARLIGRKPLGALYYSCSSRGVHMFGDEGTELGMVRRALGDMALLGFYANGEFAAGQLHGFSGVLAVVVEE